MTSRQGSRSAASRKRRDVSAILSVLATAASDRKPVSGLTHNFYRYPARFSPGFAAAAIECLSNPGDVVLDPYMGGGTTVVEGVAAGRVVVGNDLNSLAAFVAKVKVTGLTAVERRSLREWATRDVPTFTFHRPPEEIAGFIDPTKTLNLTLVKARFIKKAVASALGSIQVLPTHNARDFARCVVLRVAQWALDGRERHTPLFLFREKLSKTTTEMLEALSSLVNLARTMGGEAVLLNMDAEDLARSYETSFRNTSVDLVVTSPPYPGVHVLYHRWQVNGRRETPAPYWIAGCNDGQGASFYNFGDRREAAADRYFQKSLRTLQAIRRTMRTGAYMVQMVAFNNPADQLPRYLDNMRTSGFVEVSSSDSVNVPDNRIWREVPNRKWHARLKGKTHSANEVVLIHRAI